MIFTSKYTVAFQGSYSKTQVALLKGQQLLQQLNIHGLHASSKLIPTLEAVLTAHQLQLTDVAYLAVNHGPGAFTSLRVVVVTVNALAFATGLKTVAVCGLDALYQQVKPELTSIAPQGAIIACAFNAYSGQMYVKFFRSSAQDQAMPISAAMCLTLPQMVNYCQEQFGKQQIWVCGNFAHPELNQYPQLVFPAQWQQLEPDAATVGLLAHQKLQELGTAALTDKIMPNYLKAGFV